MSEMEKWMPKGDYKLLHLGHVTKNADAMFRRLGLRAQVAALEELIAGQTGHMVDRAKAMIEEIRREIG